MGEKLTARESVLHGSFEWEKAGGTQQLCCGLKIVLHCSTDSISPVGEEQATEVRSLEKSLWQDEAPEMFPTIPA